MIIMCVGGWCCDQMIHAIKEDFVCAQAAERTASQLKRIARAIYSNPPVHGARIVAEVSELQSIKCWRQIHERQHMTT